MEDKRENPDDAITQEEISGSDLPGHTGHKPLADPKKRNACTEEQTVSRVDWTYPAS